MKARKTMTLLLAALALTACKYDDSELWEQVNRNTEHYTGIKVDFGDTQRLFMTCGETMAVDFTAEGSDRFTTDNLFTVAPLRLESRGNTSDTRRHRLHPERDRPR